MEMEVSAEAKDKRLNRAVAITVVVLSVFTGVCGIKDGKIVQAMEAAQSRSVDLWNEYQATRTKQHLVETARAQVAALAPAGKSDAALASFDNDSARYRAEAPALATQARAQAELYDALNVHDDQFDASEAAISTAISMAAVAALVESGAVLALAWVVGAFGVFMGLCGFLGLGFHPDMLSTLLG